MPMSGCPFRIAATTKNSTSAIDAPHTFEPGSLPSAISQAATTAKKGLRNSEGCSDRPGIGSQRLAPLISTPTTSVAAVSTSAPAKPSSAKRRTPFTDSSETPTISVAAIAR